mmetsp:Transcript_39006/g.72615  ORF Transcript_39006/g.72615 Transcript_39006/m.72615 type:complete len:292 (+) Transcript_39006:464-1339(+)
MVDGDSLGVPRCCENPWVLGIPLPRSLGLAWSAAEKVLPIIRVAVHRPGAAHALAAHAVAHFAVVQHAVLVCVEGDLACLIVGVFHDVELTTIRPDLIAVHQPEGRPDRWTPRHVVVLHDDQHTVLRMPRVVRVDHDRLPLVGGDPLAGFLQRAELHENGAVVAHANDPLMHRFTVVQVALGTMSVVLCDKSELVKEVSARRPPGEAHVCRLRKATILQQVRVVDLRTLKVLLLSLLALFLRGAKLFGLCRHLGAPMLESVQGALLVACALIVLIQRPAVLKLDSRGEGCQ